MISHMTREGDTRKCIALVFAAVWIALFLYAIFGLHYELWRVLLVNVAAVFCQSLIYWGDTRRAQKAAGIALAVAGFMFLLSFSSARAADVDVGVNVDRTMGGAITSPAVSGSCLLHGMVGDALVEPEYADAPTCAHIVAWRFNGTRVLMPPAGPSAGMIEAVNGAYNLMQFWAVREHRLATVHVEIDGVSVADYVPTKERPDLSGFWGASVRGDAVYLPVQYKDGQPHSLRAFVVGADDGSRVELIGSPHVFTSQKDAPPIGSWDTFTSNGTLIGWAGDPNEPVEVVVTVDDNVATPYCLPVNGRNEAPGPCNTGAAPVTQGLSRPDVQAAYPALGGNTGWRYNLPIGYANANHVLRVFTRGADKVPKQIAGSTKTIQCILMGGGQFMSCTVLANFAWHEVVDPPQHDAAPTSSAAGFVLSERAQPEGFVLSERAPLKGFVLSEYKVRDFGSPGTGPMNGPIDFMWTDCQVFVPGCDTSHSGESAFLLALSYGGGRLVPCGDGMQEVAIDNNIPYELSAKYPMSFKQIGYYFDNQDPYPGYRECNHPRFPHGATVTRFWRCSATSDAGALGKQWRPVLANGEPAPDRVCPSDDECKARADAWYATCAKEVAGAAGLCALLKELPPPYNRAGTVCNVTDGALAVYCAMKGPPAC